MSQVEGTAYWAMVTTPNTKFKPQYIINLVVDQETAKDFKTRGFNIKQTDDGPTLVIKRQVETANGKKNAVPGLFDENMNPIDVAIGNGSKVKVKYREWETNNNYGHFKGLDLQAVQILNLVEYGVLEANNFSDEDSLLEDEL